MYKLRGCLQDLILDNTRTQPLLLRRGLYNPFVSHSARSSGNPSHDNLDWLAVIKTSLAVNYIIAR